jgi:phage-related minor tail protein
MAVNIGPKIGIDGEKEYRKQINDLITQQKTFSAEMRELESSFNSEASAMDKNRRKGELLEKSIKNQEKTVEELEKGLDASKKKYGENSTQTQKWKQAVSNAKTELNKMRTELSKVPKPLSEIGKSMQTAGKKMKSVGDSMSKYVTAPLTAIGVASVAAFKEVDDGMDNIAKMTGATGQALKDLEGSAKSIATTIPTSFETAGTAVGSVSTRFGVTGQELETLSTKFVKFSELNNTDVQSSVEGTQKVMAAFGVDTKDTGKLLDAMNKTGQKTGISMDTLQTSMVKNASALQQMGFDAYDAAGFLGQVETSGADTSQVMAGLSKALVNAADDGKTLPQALSDFQSIMSSTATEQEKLTAATDLFGKKAGPAIYEACKSGSLSFESLSTDASEYLGSVETTFESVLDPADDFTTTMNSLKLLGSEVGESLITAAAPSIKKIGEFVKDAADKFATLDENQQQFAIKAGVVLAAGGPVLSGVGRLTEGVGKVVEKMGEWSSIPTLVTTLFSNPIALGVGSVGLLIAAINLLDKDAGYVNEDIQGLVTGTNEAVTAMDTATQSLTKTLGDAEAEIGEINGKADLADDLINELADLESQTNLTATEQGRMRTIVGELNSMYPDLALEIDSSTGKLNKSTKEIKAYVEEARKIKLVEAYQKAATKGYEDLAEAGIALKGAQKQQTENQNVINDLQKEYARLTGLSVDANGDFVDSSGNFVMTAGEMDTAMSDLSNDIKTAQDKQAELVTETENAQTAYDAAEQQIAEYDQAAQDTAAELEALTGSTEASTDAVDANADAMEGSANAVEGWSSKLASGAADAIGNISEAIGAWNDLYEATRDSISKQLGLFDEWEENHDLTFGDMKKNLQSQIKGMQNYATNMGKLSRAAVQSSDPNFKALVQHLATMGIDAAGEVDTLVQAMETDKESFNEYVAMYGENYQSAIDNVAAIDAYVQNDFSTGIGNGMVAAKNALNTVFGKGAIQSGFQSFGKNLMAAVNKTNEFGTNATKTATTVNTAIGASGTKLTTTAKTSTDTATTYTKTQINGMDLKPEVKKVGVPATVTKFAKDQITSGVSGVHGSVSKVTGGATAGKAARSDAEGQLSGMKGSVSSISVSSGALSNIRSAISTFLSNNPVTAWINTHVFKHAEGGFTYKQQLSWLSEGNQPEVVIPLATAKRERALELYQETGERLGVAQPTIATVNVPDYSVPQNNVSLKFDAAKMYAACAAGAKEGMENANIKIYISDREAGRILRGMGVQFA